MHGAGRFVLEGGTQQIKSNGRASPDFIRVAHLFRPMCACENMERRCAMVGASPQREESRSRPKGLPDEQMDWRYMTSPGRRMMDGEPSTGWF